MTRSIDRVDDWHFLSGGAGPGMQGHRGKHRVWSGRTGARGRRPNQNLYWGSRGKGKSGGASG